jgi:hypothetical protein
VVISDRLSAFREIWVVDTEFYGTDQKYGHPGNLPTPLCLVAREIRSGRLIRLWQGEFGKEPPYSPGADALIVVYNAAAELGVHRVLEWGQPKNVLDLHAEFRCWANRGDLKPGEREKGWYSLPGALKLFGLNTLGYSHKHDMRDRILAGPPFSHQERIDILDYCQSDVDDLAPLINRMLDPQGRHDPAIVDLRHALFRGTYMWAVSGMEHRGVPVDLPLFTATISHWSAMQQEIIRTVDARYGVYSGTHFDERLFDAYCLRENIIWPRFPNGRPILRADTMRDMARVYPQIDDLRELRSTISKLRLHSLAIGEDGHNRASLWPFCSKTGRNQPSNSEFIFGPAKWIRFFIQPPPGRALIHRDYCQQEVIIAAVLSQDPSLLAACATGDVYLGMAKQFSFVPAHAHKGDGIDKHTQTRDLFKTVVLAINYGMAAKGLALRTALSVTEANELLIRIRLTYPQFWEFSEQMIDQAGLELELRTPLGWRMRTPPGTNPRTVKNFPMQGFGAEILRATCVLAEGRGIELVAPVHDALMAECDDRDVDDVSLSLDRAMRHGSRAVLRGYELSTDVQIIRHPDRFFDKRGLKLWNIITGLVTRLRQQSAA